MGSNYGDFDDDGFLDLLATAAGYDGLMPNLALNRAGRASPTSACPRAWAICRGHGVAFFDYDYDGDRISTKTRAARSSATLARVPEPRLRQH